MNRMWSRTLDTRFGCLATESSGVMHAFDRMTKKDKNNTNDETAVYTTYV